MQLKVKIISIWLLMAIYSYSQDQGIFSGGLEANYNIFMRDSLIGAANIPQYDRQLTGGEAWLNLNYAYKGFLVGIRFDVFNNSNLLNPTESYTDQGIGRWFIQKKINKFGIEVGYIYDQIGSGLIYRTYQSRPLLIDNALVGAKLTYDISDNWTIKGFSGKQKFLFDVNDGVIKGGSIDGYISLGSEENLISLSPGIGFVNRTFSDNTMINIINEVKTYLVEDRFIPKHNVYLASIYNTLTYKGLTWYIEAAYKSADTFFDAEAMRITSSGGSTIGKYIYDSGSVIYSSLSLALGKLGLTIEGKRTENFNFRTDPALLLTRGLINWIPPMNRVNTYRLTSRYAPAVRDLSELAYQIDAQYRFSKKVSANVNYSNIESLEGTLLYREIYSEVQIKKPRKWTLRTGIQHQKYNQEIYETKPAVKLVSTVTPFIDFLYKLSRKKSIRFESQYMSTDQDFGSWIFALVEYGIAPKWNFEASMMYNNMPSSKSPKDPVTGQVKKILYPSFGITHISGANRFNLRYVKQVEGIVCSGGVCRLEPAFSGVKFSVLSTF